MKIKRTIGVSFFAYLNIAGGILGIVGLLAGTNIIMYGAPLLIVIGIGLLKLKEWARKLEILATILGYFFRWAVIFTVSKDLSLSINYMLEVKQIVSLVAVIITVWFFTRSKVKEQFKE